MWSPSLPLCESEAKPSRRRLLGAALLLPVFSIVARPAQAMPAAMQAAIRDLIGDAPLRQGRIKLEIAPLVENGNTVPVTLRADSPMTTTDHVRRMALFTEANPQPQVAVFHLGPRAGRAMVYTRMRLATSQAVTAIAEMSDGSLWQDSAQVIVTLAACVEG